MKKLPSKQPKLIWILDDDQPILDLLGEILKTEKWQIQLFPQSSQLLSSLQVKTPDLLLIDFLMPDINGLTLILKLRENPALANTPIILMSADNRLDYQKISKGTSILHKPFEMEVVLSLVRKSLS